MKKMVSWNRDYRCILALIPCFMELLSNSLYKKIEECLMTQEEHVMLLDSFSKTQNKYIGKFMELMEPRRSTGEKSRFHENFHGTAVTCFVIPIG